MTHPLEHQDLVFRFIPDCRGKRCLDCGCGKGVYGFYLRSIKEGEDAYVVGVDLHLPYLRFAKKFQVYDELVMCDVRALPFRGGSFHIILAMEIIEHLPKMDGYPFLRQLKCLATNRVVVTTPNGYYGSCQAHQVVGTMRHLSGWSVTDLRKLGFHVRGFGCRFIRYTKVPYIYGLLDSIFTPLAFVFPRFSSFLVAFLEISRAPSC